VDRMFEFKFAVELKNPIAQSQIKGPAGHRLLLTAAVTHCLEPCLRKS